MTNTVSPPTLSASKFFKLVDYKETEKVRQILEAATPEQKKEFLAFTNSIGETGLLLSARLGCADMVATLLEHGADIQALDSDKGNVLQNAALHSNALAVFELLFAHTDCENLLTQEDNEKKTVFHVCLGRYGAVYLVDFLIDKAKTLSTLEYFEQVANRLSYRMANQHPQVFTQIQEKMKVFREKELFEKNIASVPDNTQNLDNRTNSFKI